MAKKTILIVTGRYLPGFKDGGPVRSILNLTDALGEEYDFRLLTCDRDHGDTEAYPNIQPNAWNRVRKALVWYVPPGGFTFDAIQAAAQGTDLIYVCGCFNDYARNTLILKRLGKLRQPVVVAAMGLLSPNAFRLKYAKKQAFMTVFNLLGLFRTIAWSATSEQEKTDINAKVWGKNRIFIAEDLPRKVLSVENPTKKQPGSLSVAWISRISPQKNLHYAIERLRSVSSSVSLTLYGDVFDEAYWANCQKALALLPENVTWEYRGAVSSEEVVPTLRNHHIFLFSTLSENYGHVIQEALSAGLPCIISDQTPWQDLEAHQAGFVFPLEHPQAFTQAVEAYAAMDQAQWDACSRAALNYAIRNSNEKVTTTGYRRIFDCTF